MCVCVCVCVCMYILYIYIKDIILRLGFDSEKLLGKNCYDGWATMMGKKKEIATQIKNDIQPLALSTLCHAPSLSLSCDYWIRNAAVVSKSLDTSNEITKLVKFSPKRDPDLQKIPYEEEYCKNEENCSSKFTTFRLFSGI